MHDTSELPLPDFTNAWDQSYLKNQNTLFYPSEPVIAFVNKYIRRRTGADSFSREFLTPPIALDIGSGAGRHLQYLFEAGFFPIGVELSSVACEQARSLLNYCGVHEGQYRIINSPAADLPLADCSVDYCISVATLDSMSKGEAIIAISEIHRVLRPGGMVYVDLIAASVARHGVQLSENEYLVDEDHEKGTVQTHFDLNAIHRLFRSFHKVSIHLTQTLSPEGKILDARWSAVYKRGEDV